MNKKIVLVSSILVILAIFSIAQSGNQDLITGMFGYKMTASYSSNFIFCFVILKLIAVAAVSFIFSLIFWYTHKWVMRSKRK